ncbi:hypothetical protein L7F22_056012 [Adiantum nelumboides]|nr:hypothetical protein [Adiantum nelumboides]
MDYCKKLEKLVNAIASYFNASSKRMEGLELMQSDLACPILRMEHTFDIRWLSRYRSISKVVKCLDSILAVTKVDAPHIYRELSNFECLYCLHFMADILRGLATLSQMFQKKFVDVTTVESLVQNEIACIKQYYVDAPKVDINAYAYGVDGFAILPEYGPDKGYLHGFRNSLHGKKLCEHDL